MRDLLYKEFRLCMQPLTLIFYSFVLMLLIPNYMYLVPAFFTTNAIFNLFQSAVTNNDLAFTVMLPIGKKDAVKGRYMFVVLIELVTVLLYVPMILLNNLIVPQPTHLFAACPTLIGGVLLVFAVFNSVFLPGFYKTGYKTGKPFLLSSIAVFLCIFLFEGFFMAAKLLSDTVWIAAKITDTFNCIPKDGVTLAYQLIAAAVCMLAYAGATALSCRVSQKRLEKVDL